jgi:hypothetical protein
MPGAIVLCTQGRDYIGGTYCSHDNRGSAGKASVPVIHRDAVGKYPMEVKPPKTEIARLLASCHDPFSAKPGDAQHDYGGTTTAPVAARVDKVLSGDTRDMTDAENVESAFDQEGAGQWIMAGYTGHVSPSAAHIPRGSRPVAPTSRGAGGRTAR